MMVLSARHHTPRSSRGIVLILLALGLYAPGGPAGELSEAPDASTLELSLPDLSGQPRGLDEFAGKVVLVNFWASWCRPCIEEMPTIQRLAEAMHDRPFAVIGVNVGETRRRVQTAVKRLGIDFPVLLDKDNAVFRRWGATVLPSAYVLGRDGRIRFVARGPLEWDRVDIVETLRELADQPTHHEYRPQTTLLSSQALRLAGRR
ncbi:MAG: TlpA disulfide reductase family protein [Sedimenticolaceae bacterium]